MKMLLRKLSLLIILFFISLSAVSQSYEWAKSMGGIENDQGFSTTIDDLGNVYTTGYFNESGDFDPSSTVMTLTSAGNYDIFIQKLNAFGNLIWAKSIGGASFDSGYSISVDDNQNVYITGSFRTGPVDFDPGEGELSITSNGGDDIFIVKLDIDGNFVWVKTMGGGNSDVGQSIKVMNNNIYVTGYFSLSVDFDPGIEESVLTAAGDKDIFILNLDTDGHFKWARKFGGGFTDMGNGITADNNGFVYTTGSFRGTVDFDPGVGVFELTSEGSQDVFIVKLDTNGDFVWAKSFYGRGTGSAIAVDTLENVFISGYFWNTVDFNPGIGGNILTSTASSSDVFVAKLDENGDYLWAKKIGSHFGDYGYGIALDDSINVYVTGTFKGEVDFNPGVGTSIIKSKPTHDNVTVTQDVFVLKLDRNGEYIFAKAMGGASDDYGKAIAVTGRGDVVIAGYYSGTADFDPGTAVKNLTSKASSNDIFVVKLTCNSVGTDVVFACDSLKWIDGITYTSSNSTASVIIPNATGCDSTVYLDLSLSYTSYATDTIIVCNSFTWIDGNTYTADNDTALFTISNPTGCNLVKSLKLTVNYSDTTVMTVVACDSMTWIDGNSYYADNSLATHTLTNMNGCDSVVKLDLTILNSSSSIQTVAACDSFTWINGVTYYNSIIDTYLLPNALGCDSIITLNLTIGTADSIVQEVIACDSFTWINGETYTESNNTALVSFQNNIGCDSIIFLKLEVNYSNTGIDNISACNSYTWIDNIEYTSDNTTATFALTNVKGCDSIVTLNLNIDYIDISINIDDTTITSNQTGASYQWINCNGNKPISGAISQSFTPETNGIYAVKITKDGCSVISDCISISHLGLKSINQNDWKIYPNPTKTELIVELATDSYVEIVDVLGKIICSYSLKKGKNILNVEQLSLGIYMLKTDVNSAIFVKN